MDTKGLAIFIAVFFALAFRLYKWYTKKNTNKSIQKDTPAGSFPSSVKDDDYEPYSKK